MAALRILIVLVLSSSSMLAQQGSSCTLQQHAVDFSRSRIKGDENSIRQLKAGLTSDDLQQWADAAKAERQRILIDSLKSAASSLLDFSLAAPGDAAANALKPMDIAGYHLPRGIGSLGTGQANAIIGRLQGLNTGSPELIALIADIRELSAIGNKAGTLEFVSQSSKIASRMKDSAEVANSSDSVETTAALFQLAAGLAGKGNFAVSVGNALFQGGSNLFDAYIMSSSVKSLSNATELQLKAIATLSKQLQRDVQGLQDAKGALDACSAMEARSAKLQRCLTDLVACHKTCGLLVDCIESCNNVSDACQKAAWPNYPNP